MNRIRELFGMYCDDTADYQKAVSEQICPFSHKKCYKTRKSNPETAIGTCTISYRDQNIIICPNRLTENNQIFIDCLHLLTLHEPGNELFVIPEVSIPGGSVDYFLVSAKDRKIKDFVGIELQTMDTTGTVWPERQRLLSKMGFDVNASDTENKKQFGINWKMTAKTILVQIHHKASTFESINKHLVLIIQKPFFEYINKEFSFSHIHGVRMGDSVHIHTYDLKENQNGLKIALETRVSTDSQGIAKSLDLKTDQMPKLEELITALEKRLDSRFALSLFQ